MSQWSLQGYLKLDDADFRRKLAGSTAQAKSLQTGAAGVGNEMGKSFQVGKQALGKLDMSFRDLRVGMKGLIHEIPILGTLIYGVKNPWILAIAAIAGAFAWWKKTYSDVAAEIRKENKELAQKVADVWIAATANARAYAASLRKIGTEAESAADELARLNKEADIDKKRELENLGRRKSVEMAKETDPRKRVEIEARYAEEEARIELAAIDKRFKNEEKVKSKAVANQKELAAAVKAAEAESLRADEEKIKKEYALKKAREEADKGLPSDWLLLAESGRLDTLSETKRKLVKSHLDELKNAEQAKAVADAAAESLKANLSEARKNYQENTKWIEKMNDADARRLEDTMKEQDAAHDKLKTEKELLGIKERESASKALTEMTKPMKAIHTMAGIGGFLSALQYLYVTRQTNVQQQQLVVQRKIEQNTRPGVNGEGGLNWRT